MNVSVQDEGQRPKRRPVSVLIIGLLFIAIGLYDVWLGVNPLTSKQARLASDDLLVSSIGTIAVVGGIGVLSGHNWARWLLAAWMAFHVALSIRQPYALLGHIVIFGLILAGLFYPAASTYFQGADRLPSK